MNPFKNFTLILEHNVETQLTVPHDINCKELLQYAMKKAK